MSLVAYAIGITFLSGQYSEMFWHFIALGAALEQIFINARKSIAQNDLVPQ